MSAAVIATRIASSFAAAHLQWQIIPLIRDRNRMPTNGTLAVLSWCGMRGAVTLAAALALPFATDSGAGFPERNLIVFLAFAVIVVTLVIQGLTLPTLARAVDLPTEPSEPQEEAYAWTRAMEAGLARLEELHDEPWVDPNVVQRLRDTFDLRLAQYAARKHGETDLKAEKRVRASRHLRRELLDAERAAVVELLAQARSATWSSARCSASSTSRTLGSAAARRARPRPGRARRRVRPARPARLSSIARVNFTSSWIACTRSTEALRSATASTLPTSRSWWRTGSAK